jgi:hypothetical protein
LPLNSQALHPTALWQWGCSIATPKIKRPEFQFHIKQLLKPIFCDGKVEMLFPTLSELIPILQISIGPVILISGIGLLLLTISNRLGRTIDRARILQKELPLGGSSDARRTRAQLQILWHRADHIRQSIILSTVSALLAAFLIITLFITTLLRLDAGWLIALLFIGCLIALVWSLLLFLKDVNQALLALKLELGDAIEESTTPSQ